MTMIMIAPASAPSRIFARCRIGSLFDGVGENNIVPYKNKMSPEQGGPRGCALHLKSDWRRHYYFKPRQPASQPSRAHGGPASRPRASRAHFLRDGSPAAQLASAAHFVPRHNCAIQAALFVLVTRWRRQRLAGRLENREPRVRMCMLSGLD